MKNKILLLVIIISATFYVDSYAQQEAQYTQYMYNTLSYNPAYAGQRDVFSVVGLHRSQWVGLDGAPSIQAFNVNSPLGVSNGNAGFSVIRDQIGVNNRIDIAGTYAYNLSIGTKSKLALF